MNTTKITLCATLLLLTVFVAACGTGTQPTQPPSGPTSAPALSGAELLQARCGTCHAVSRATQARMTRAEWESTVARMVQNGASLTSIETQALVEHLAQKYGK